VVVFNSLSKRSSLAGLRSGFIAGDSEIVSRVRRHRSDVGTTPPESLSSSGNSRVPRPIICLNIPIEPTGRNKTMLRTVGRSTVQ
jgi:hypothetical protein